MAATAPGAWRASSRWRTDPGTARAYDPDSNESLADFVKRQNLGSFTLGPVSLQVSAGERIGVTGPNGDVYIYAHTQVDAQASYTFKNGLKVILSGLNLNNEVFGFYAGSPQWNIQREFYDRTFTVGLKKNW